MQESHSRRGAALGDFDNDGAIDVLIMNMNEPPSLLRNDVSGPNHWLKVLRIGVESSRSAIGAQVVARYGARRRRLYWRNLRIYRPTIAGCASGPDQGRTPLTGRTEKKKLSRMWRRISWC